MQTRTTLEIWLDKHGWFTIHMNGTNALAVSPQGNVLSFKIGTTGGVYAATQYVEIAGCVEAFKA